MPLTIVSTQHFNIGGGGSPGTPYIEPGEVGFLGNEGDLDVVTDTVISRGPGTYEGVFFDGGLYLPSTSGTYTFRQSVIQGKAASWLIFAYESQNSTIVLEDCTLRWKAGDALDPGGQGVIQNLGVSATVSVTRCDISGKADGLQLAGSCEVVDCHVHDLVFAGTFPDNTHNDGIQFYAGDLTVTGSYFDVGALFPYSNSCIFFQGATIDQVSILNNYFNGGGYSYYAQNGSHTVVGNTFGPERLYGTHLFEGAGPTVAQWDNNVNHIGAPVPL